MSSSDYKHTSTTTQPHGEGQLKATPACMTPKPDSRPKPAIRNAQKPGTSKVSCFICGGPHYARDCPPENWEAACGYAVQIAEDGTLAPLDNAESEHHSPGSIDNDENGEPPKPDNLNSGSKGGEPGLEGEQYDPDEVNDYPFTVSKKTDS